MNGKRIEISKSSLLSLKAEVLRKQEEVKKAKLLAKPKIVTRMPKPETFDKKNTGVEQREERDFEEINAEVDVNLIEKSRLALESKTRLYERLSSNQQYLDNDELKSQYLVQFDQKLQEENEKHLNDDIEECNEIKENDVENQEDDEHIDSEDEWVEFTDCLGRSRRCLREDLSFIKSRDEELRSTLNTNKCPTTIQSNEIIEIDDNDEGPELVSADMKRDAMRKKWEEQEEQLLKKSDVHYQDVLYDEARAHGVGYFSFSRDEKERSQQQRSLTELREETRRQQEAVNEKRAQRDKALAARRHAALNRKRTRMGLPPLEDNEDEEQIQELESRSDNKVDDSTEVPVDKEVSAEDRARELARQQHVRPWDLPKLKKREIMSQDEWVANKRSERPNEFAPPSFYIDCEGKDTKEVINRYKNSKNETLKEDTLDEDEADTNNRANLFFTSRKPKSFRNDWRKDMSSQEENDRANQNFIPTRIVDEPIDGSSINTSRNETKDDRSFKRKYSEIPPPPEYSDVNTSSIRVQSASTSSIRASVEAGLRFLREQAEKKQRRGENVGFFE